MVLIRMSLLHRKGQKNPKKKNDQRKRKKNHHFNFHQIGQAGETKKRPVMKRFTEGLWEMMNGKIVRMMRMLRL